MNIFLHFACITLLRDHCMLWYFDCFCSFWRFHFSIWMNLKKLLWNCVGCRARVSSARFIETGEQNIGCAVIWDVSPTGENVCYLLRPVFACLGALSFPRILSVYNSNYLPPVTLWTAEKFACIYISAQIQTFEFVVFSLHQISAPFWGRTFKLSFPTLSHSATVSLISKR